MSDYDRKESLEAKVEHHEAARELTELSSIEDTASSRAVWLISATVSMGGFLFGYDTGYISSVLVTLGTDLGGSKLSSNEQELITSITSGGALVGAILAGLSADRYGRKLSIYLGCILFVLGAVLQATAFSLAQMTVGRFVVGLGVGSAAMIIPMYIGELAPAKHRGRMIALENVTVAGGQFFAYCVGAGFAEVVHGWRYMVAIGGIPAIILAFLLPWCPESPRQLAAHGKVEECDAVLQRLYPAATIEQRTDKYRSIELSLQEGGGEMSGRSLWWSLKQLHTVPSNFRALVSACTVMAISQLGVSLTFL